MVYIVALHLPIKTLKPALCPMSARATEAGHAINIIFSPVVM